MTNHDDFDGGDEPSPARYADRECSDCGMILPANQMVRARDKVISGGADRYTRHSGTGVNSTRSGHDVRYRIETVDLCPNCVNIRNQRALDEAAARDAENAHRATQRNGVIVAVILLIIAVVVGIVWGKGASPQGQTSNEVAATPTDAPVMPLQSASDDVANQVSPSVNTDATSSDVDNDDQPLLAGSNSESYDRATAPIMRSVAIYKSWGSALKECEDVNLGQAPLDAPRGYVVGLVVMRCRGIAQQLPGMLQRAGIAPKDSDYISPDQLKKYVEQEMREKFGAP